MTIDAVLVAITMPYEVFLDNVNKDLEYLYDQISNTSEPILQLNTIKKNFDINNYTIHISKHDPHEIKDEYPDHIKKILETDNIRREGLNNKEYIKLNKDDIKNMFSVEIWRDNQLSKLI